MRTLEPQQSAKRTGHFARFNCLVLGHTKHSKVQRVYSNPFPKKTFYSWHKMDLVMIRPPGIEAGAFVVKKEHLRKRGKAVRGGLGLYSFFQPLQTQTLDWSHLTVHWSRRSKPMTIPKTVIIVIIYIMVFITVIAFLCVNYLNNCNFCNYFDYCHYLLFDRMVGVDRLADCLRARPQEPCSVFHPDTKHSVKTASCPRRQHGDHFIPPSQRLSRRIRRPQAGIGRWLLDVVSTTELSTRGRWDGPGICNEKEVGSSRDATWIQAPCERAAAAASPFSCSARGCSVCGVQNPRGSSNSITVMENTD